MSQPRPANSAPLVQDPRVSQGNFCFILVNYRLLSGDLRCKWDIRYIELPVTLNTIPVVLGLMSRFPEFFPFHGGTSIAAIFVCEVMLVRHCG